MRSVSFFQIVCVILAATVGSSDLHAEENKLRIINGHSSLGWSWVVALSDGNTSPDQGQFCAGTLITSRLVATAAHCVVDFVDQPNKLHIVLGRSQLSSSEGDVLSSDGIIVHPDYSSYTQENDFALIRLERDVDYEPIHILSALEEANLPINQEAMILGWGTTNPEQELRPIVLQQALVPVVANASCAESYGADFHSDSMLCAGVLSSSSEVTDGVDTCFGDSGGPLVVQTSAGWKLLGLTSWGADCASLKYWGIYTRASKFLEWAVSPHVVKPYSLQAPVLSGIPVWGERMTCEGWNFGGDTSTTTKVLIRDRHSGRILSRTGSLLVRRHHFGKKIYCQVQNSNAAGTTSVVSSSIGPIYNLEEPDALRIKNSSSLRTARIYCFGKSCSLVFAFSLPLQSVKGFIKTRGHCSTGSAASCSQFNRWKKARKLNQDTWALSFDSNPSIVSSVVLHADGLTQDAVVTKRSPGTA